MIEWVDATSYSRDAKVKKQTAWATNIGGLRIYITCAHIYYPDEWIMHCNQIGINTKPLHVDTLEHAKIKAFAIVQSQINEWKESLDKACE